MIYRTTGMIRSMCNFSCSFTLLPLNFYTPTPPTKEGKENGYRQTNARTVNIIKYINFFNGPVKKWHLNGTVLRPVFMAQKYPPSKHLKQTPGRVVFFSKKKLGKMVQNEPFWVPKTGVVTGNFWSPSVGVVETDFLRRADFSVGYNAWFLDFFFRT